MVMAGGTGGHVFPGLAVAHRMQEWGWRVVWLGNPAGMEATLVPKHGIEMEYVRFGGVRGKGLKTKLMLPVNLLRACTQSLAALRRVKPDVVLGMGGYITFPAGVMSAISGRPLVLHEQNSIAGLANKVLAKLAKRVLVAFPGALPHGEWTGNPIRAALEHVVQPKDRYAQRSGPRRGGAQRSRAACAVDDGAGRASVRHASGGREAHRRTASELSRRRYRTG
jgi:UDP-N-acetylglucosamine--N-acetylmuramyl-(pentapeptide) pyrophosphoryl-undecaprenol N-acetylglucosamine transferase